MRCVLGQHRSWIFPRDPEFAAKAGQVLDLYERVWEGSPLGVDDFVLSADEKTSVQARRRKQPTLAPAAARPMRVEHEYFREGAWPYLAAWDVHRAKVFGRCESKNGIGPVDRLVSEVMNQAPIGPPAGWSGSWTIVLLIAAEGRRPFPLQVAQCHSGPYPDPCQLAQPDRDLLVDRSKKSSHPQRLPFFGPTPRAAAGFPDPLRT